MEKIKNKIIKSNIIIIIFVLLFIFVLIGFIWFFYSYQQVKKQMDSLTNKMQTDGEMSSQEVDALLKEVENLIILPQDQGQPMIATIKDANKLKQSDPFYVDAQNGDKLIVYKTKAIIYNPSRKKIINVGPVYLSNDKQNEEIISLDIRNGSHTIGVASDMAEKLGQMKEFKIADIKNANNQEFSGTMIINLSGKNIQNLENILNVKAINSLPEGESSSSADVVIIIGN